MRRVVCMTFDLFELCLKKKVLSFKLLLSYLIMHGILIGI